MRWLLEKQIRKVRLSLICYMLYVIYYILYIICYMLYVILYIIYYILYIIYYIKANPQKEAYAAALAPELYVLHERKRRKAGKDTTEETRNEKLGAATQKQKTPQNSKREIIK